MTDPVSFGLATSAISSVAVGGFGLLGVFKNIAKKPSVSGLVLTVGKTTVCKKMSDRKTYFLDIDEYLFKKDPEAYAELQNNSVQFMVHFGRMAQAYVLEMCQIFENKHLVVVSNNQDLLEQLKVKKVRVFVPSGELVQSLPLTAEEKSAIDRRRLFHAGGRKFEVFGSFGELDAMLKSKYKLRAILNLS